MSCGLTSPGPAEDFTLVPLSTKDIPAWYHVYSTKTHPTKPDSFAQGWDDTRFAPILQADRTPVHTFYAASTVEATYLESVLHDIPLSPPGQFDVSELAHFHLVQLELSGTIECVSFHTPYLPKLNLSRAQLIDSIPACYPETRAWAQAAYLQCGTAQALAYGSRRDDAARCVMLFGQRLPTPPFTVLKVEPLALSPRRDEILALVRRLGINEI